MTKINHQRIKDADIWLAADELGCEPAAVRAVLDVESDGGFLPDGRPKILFERHYFSRLTGGRHDRTHPHVSNRVAGGYRGGAAEHDRLDEAVRLDRGAALRSASWGLFQIMGANFGACGFDSVDRYVEAMKKSESEQLRAFVAFLLSQRLAIKLRERDWAGFARRYNGPDYGRNRYDEKLAAAFARHSGERPVLRRGDRGGSVRDLQAALGIPVDGVFGAATEAALIAFQRAQRLAPDGAAGAATWTALAAWGEARPLAA